MSELKQIEVEGVVYDVRDAGAVRKAQGADNAGKLLGIGTDGNVGPVNGVAIDDVPTEGSENAVSSGGVWSALQESGGGGVAFPARQIILTTSQTLDLAALGIKVGDAIALLCIGGGGGGGGTSGWGGAGGAAGAAGVSSDTPGGAAGTGYGGGGGGGGATKSTNSICGDGGGSGYAASGFFTVTTLTVAVTIGAGGAGGAARGSGGNGGTTSFGSILSAAGGDGGRAGSSGDGTGGAGGNTGGKGDTKSGGAGGNGWLNLGIGAAIEAGSAISGGGCVMLWY